ncbi:MAG: fibronectin type III domain-containing protein [Bacteroidales bacterium]|nr:fibronectin type III domain-containing protein [Bacteroidales bacterium]
MKKLVLFSLFLFVGLGLANVSAQAFVTIGTGTASSYDAPFNNWYEDSWNEVIYPASEFFAGGGSAGMITAISYYSASTESFIAAPLRIYLGTTSRTTHSSSSDWQPMNQLTLVYDHSNVTLGGQTGWQTFQLDNPFFYGGSENLVVVVAKHTDRYTDMLTWNYTSVANSCLYQEDDEDPSMYAHPGTSMGTTCSFRPNIRLTMTLSNCPSITPTVVNLGTYNATLNWRNYNQSAVSFDLAYGPASTFDTLTSTVITGLTDTSYNLTNLTSATTYMACVKSHCTAETGTWSGPRTFTTQAACPTPTNLAVGTVSYDQATVTWTPGATETSWELMCVPHDSAITYGTSVYPTLNTHTLTGLTPNTPYDVYVRASCGNGEYSYWTAVTTFRTSCLPLAAMPFMENFDSHPGSTASNVNNLPTCWNYINNGTTSYIGYPINYNSVSYAASGTNSLRFYTYSPTTYGDQVAVLPGIDVTAYPLNTLQLSFDARSYSTSNTFKLVIGVLSNPTDLSTFVPVDSISTSLTTYGHYEIPLTSYVGTGSFIGIMARHPISGYNYGNVDNIVLEPIPNCSRPTQVAVGSITTSSVTVDWIPGGQEPLWEVLCVPQGQSVATATPEQAYTHPHTISNLNDDTPYEVYVRAMCVAGGYSSWSSVVTFTTDPFCTPPTQLTVDQIRGTSALVSWHAAQVGADSYTLEYSEHGLNNWSPLTVMGTMYMLSGLTPETSYDVRVFSNCLIGDADTANMTFDTECLSIDKAAFEDGTSTTSYMPVSNSYNYSMSQQLFLADEMHNSPMVIKQIAFEYKYSLPTTAKTNVDIYLGHTTKSTFSGTSDWVSFSNLQRVYTGNLNCQQGWNTFVLDIPFSYNGIDNLVLVVDDNSGSSNGSTSYAFAYKSQSPNYRTLYYYNASTNPNPQSPPAANTRTYNRNNVRFMSECDLTATCIKPNAYVTNVTETSITVDWAPGNYENSWQMEYSTDGTIWTQGGSVTAPYTLTNLTPDMDYFIRLRSDCGGGDYSTWAMVRAHTPCAAVTIPYTENFETAPGSGSGNMVSCWTTLSNYTSTHYPYTSSSQHHSGTYSVYFYGTSAYYSYLISPRMDDAVQMNNLEVSFWAYKGSASYFIQVGVMSDPNDPSTFVQVGSNISPTATSTWEFWDVNTSLYTGQGKYIAFRIPENIANYMYIDDIDIHVLPTCAHVRNIQTTSLGSSSANVSWTAGGTEQEWLVVYGPAGTIVDPEYELATATTVYTPSISLTNLNGGCTYDVYVKAVCNASDSSMWMQYSFRTDCGYISHFPYTENFETFTSGSGGAINCWTRNGLYNASTYPYVNTSYSTSGSKSLYFYVVTNSTYSSYPNIYSSIALPAIDPTVPVNTLQMAFKMRTSSVASAKMIVGVMTNPSDMSTFTPVQTLGVSTANVFENFEVDFSSYTGTGSYIAFKTQFTSSYNAYVDDIKLSLIPTCKRPLDVEVTTATTNSATIDWTARNGETSWQVVVVPHGQSVSSGTPEYVTQYPYTVQGLSDATVYDVYVKADCNNNDLSEWSEPVTFHTKCLPTSTMPYYESFEGVGSGSGVMPICWTAKTDYVTTTQYPNVSTSQHSQGSAALYFYKPAANYMYAASQALDLSNYAAGDLAISYNLMPVTGLSYARIDVGIMTDPDDPTTFTCLRSHYPDEFPTLTTWYSFSIPLTEAYSTPIYVAFYAPESSVTTYMYVDEVKVDAAPLCSAPMNLSFSQIHGASALVSWTDSQYGDGDYTVEYSSDNINWNTEIVAGNHVMLTGLTPMTMYNVRVSRNCTSGNPVMQTGYFNSGCYAGGDVAVGNGTSTTYSLPINNNYKYSFSQQIYLSSEMGDARDITSLSFDYAYTTSMTAKNNVSIYLGNTTQSTFSSTTNYVPITNQQLVYTGPLNCRQGWNTFNLTTPFHYNGTSNLVITIDDNSNNKNSSSYTFRVHSAGATRTIYYYSDTGNPDPSNPTGASTSKTTSSNRGNIIFGSPCDTVTTCFKPNAYISARDHESLTVTWGPGSTESAWDFEYKAASDASWTQIQGATSPQVLSNLTANTVYNIRLRSDCGSGDYSDWRTLVGETECDAFTVPYSQNFDSTAAATGAMVPCWTRGTNNSTAYPYLYATYSESMPNSVYFYSTSAYYSYLASPRFDDSTVMDSLLIRFKAKKTTATSPYFIEVGIMTDPNDYNTFTGLGSFAPSTLDFEDGEVRTSGYTGNGRYVAFRSPRVSNTIYLDDVQIDYIPNCLHVENVHAVASSITATSAEVVWTPGGDETEWNVVIGPAGTILDPSLETPQVIYGTPSISLSNLTGNTPYEVFVQGHCNNGENSVWVTGTFRTACVPITMLPYEENFESYTPGSSSIHRLPPCWDYINYGSASMGCPTIYNNTTYAAPGGNGNALYFYSYSSSSYADQIAILPEIDVTAHPMNTLRLYFDARQYSTANTYVDYVEIGVLEGTNLFVVVDTVKFTSTTIGTHHVDFSSYNGPGNRIAIRAPLPTGSFTYNYTWLDNIKIDVMPSCYSPTNFQVSSLTSNSVDLTWTDAPLQTTWQVMVIPASQNPDYTQAQTVTNNTYSVSYLNENIQYKAYLRTVCSGGQGYSEWISTTFKTPCQPLTTLPFSENFDSYTGSTSGAVNNLPSCWANYNHGTSTSYSGYPIIYNSSSYANSGTNALRFYTYITSGTYDDQVAILPPIDVTTYPLNTLKLSFDARANSTSYTFQLVVGVMTNPSDISTFVPVQTVQTQSTTYGHYGVLLDQYTGTGNFIAIKAPRPTSGYNYGYVDNIVLDIAPSCSSPTNFQASNLTPTSADLSWTDSLTEGTWQLLVSPANQTPNYSQAQTVTNNTQSLTSLTVNTQYRAYLRTVCSNGLGNSEWITTDFTTPCQALTTLPFSENFDTYAGATSTSVSVNNLPSCWANFNNGTSTTYSGYPIIYNNSSYAASGTNALRFYTLSAAGTYGDQVAVLPPIDATLYPINGLMMSFDARALNADNTFELVVGVMTNPSDISTFVPVQTVYMTSTTYASQEISFAQYTGTGNFIAIKAPKLSSGSNYGYVDNILVDESPTCSPVHDLTVSQIVATSALLSWEDGLFGTPVSYQVDYKAHSASTWTTASSSVASSPYMLSGLTLNTNYDVRVKANCSDGSSSNNWVTAQFTTAPCLVPQVINIGNGTSTSYYLPVNNYYNFTYSQQIYLASEMNGPATLTSVSFEYDYSLSSKKPEVVIYLGHTTKSTFTSTSDYIALSNLTQVYRGPLDCVQGWNTFTFTTPFQYNGTSNLVLAIDDNSDGYSGSAYVFKVHSTSPSYRSLYYYSDSNNPDPSNPTLVSTSSSYTSGNRSNVRFGGGCNNNATCVAPNVYVTDVTTTTATVNWAPGNTESLWSLQYQAEGDATWTSVGTQSSSPVTLTGLTPGMPYTVRMRSECGGSDTSTWVTAEFATECVPIAQLPFSENFDSYTGSTSGAVNNLPLCWGYLNNGTSTSYAGYPINYNGTTYAASTPNSIRFYTYTTAGTYDDQILVLPQVDVNANAMNTLQLSFDARNQGSYTFTLVVGVMTDPRNKATFVPVDTIVTTSNIYANYDVPFNNYTGTGTYIALMAPRPASSYNAGYVDNIMVDLIPSCPKPHDLTVTNVTTNSASLSWTEMGSAYNWNVQYGPAGFALGSGTTIQVQNTPSTTITGLNANTSYDFYVQADCMGGDTSYWTTKVTCVTPCNMLTQLPFVENFDNVQGATTTSVNISNLPSCWYNINTSTYSGYLGYPIVYNSSSYANSGLNSLRFYAGSGTYGSQMAILPPIDATLYPMNTLQLSLDARALSTSYPFNLEVGILTNPMDMTTFVPLTTITSQVTTYANYEVPFSQYTGSGNYIGIRAAQTTSGMNYGYVDNIRVELIPTCPKPSNVAVTGSTQTSVTLSWTENGSATNWNVEYGPAGYMQGTGTTVQASTNPFTVTGLSASTMYDFYVQSDCGGGDVSNWSQKAAGATQCDAITQVPYTENFDSYGTGTTAYPNCWSKINTYTGGDRPYCNASSYGGSVASLYFFATSGTYNIAIMPEVSSTIPVNTLKVNFMLKGTSSYTTPLSVGVMTNPLDASTYVEVATVPFDATITNWVSREVSFANYTGTGHYIAFKNGSSSTSCYTYMDNLVLDLNGSTPPTPPTCATPTGLAVAANTITQTTATATWNAGGTETAWDLQYKQHNATSWGNVIPLTARTYNFTGLTAGTFYDVRVRANCGNNDVSDWTSAVTFQTETQGSNPCNDPTGLNYTDVNTTSVVLDWTENGTATSWTVNYKENASAQWSTAMANEHPYTLTGLQPETGYQVYVVANCAEGQSGVSNMVSFTTLGVGINDYEQAISLYPNPNNGQFTVISDQWTVNRVQVYDVYGKLLKTVEVNANTTELDVRELSAGMYFVRISTEKGVVTKSFVKK